MIGRIQGWLIAAGAIFAAILTFGRMKKTQGATEAARKLEKKDADAVRKAGEARNRALRDASGDGLRRDDGHRRD